MYRSEAAQITAYPRNTPDAENILIRLRKVAVTIETEIQSIIVAIDIARP
jgi:hypothetical protein